MNSSENLICLSDSGAGQTISNSNVRAGIKNQSSTNESGETELLIDFTDEVQGPVSHALMTLAEMDDTFGIFSMAQASQNMQQLIQSDDASKLVRSFTSGRKSDVHTKTEIKPDAKICEEPVENSKNTNADEDSKYTSAREDSIGSIHSDQPTVMDPEEIDAFIPLFPTVEFDEAEQGIMDEKPDVNSYASGGSDSDILDVNNLSSFSIPDVDQDDNEYLENIKIENEADASISTAFLDQIRLELLQNDDNTQGCTLDNIVRPSFSSTNTTKSRFSTASSVVSSSTRLSCKSNKFDDNDETCARRARVSNISNISRISGIFSSPIRNSYPVSKYYMPTPSNQKTPSRVRDKLSESMYSPSMTRVVRTGDSKGSPLNRVLTRKSISAETLHYERSPAREATRTVFKFSTPAAPSKSRHSFSAQAGMHEQNTFSVRAGAFYRENMWNMAREDVREHSEVSRLGRLSTASSVSTTSINTLSPTGSTCSVQNRDLSEVVRQMKQMRLNETAKSNRTGGHAPVFAAVQPMKATAVIPPNIPVQGAQTETKRVISKTHHSSSASTPSGQRKFIPPIAASSPKLAPSPAKTNLQTTPSRSRYNVNIRSSGYGAQNLNSTFGSKTPLTSPNPKVPTTTSIKPPVIHKPTIAKPETGRLNNYVVKPSMPMPAIKPKASAPVTTGLRRPATGFTSTNNTNKENNARAAVSRIAFSRPRQ